MYQSQWLNATIDIDRSTQFAGDDVDRYTSIVDLGSDYESLVIIVPALDAASTIAVFVQELAAVATVPIALHAKRDADETTSAQWLTTSGAGSFAITCNALGCFRYIRIKTSANQAADRTFRVRGVRS